MIQKNKAEHKFSDLKRTGLAKHTRTQRSIEYLIMYFHVIAFKQLILKCACKAIKPIAQKTWYHIHIQEKTTT